MPGLSGCDGLNSVIYDIKCAMTGCEAKEDDCTKYRSKVDAEFECIIWAGKRELDQTSPLSKWKTRDDL